MSVEGYLGPRRLSDKARDGLIWIRGVGTQGYSGRRVSNTTAVHLFPFIPLAISSSLPSQRSFALPSFLSSAPLT